MKKIITLCLILSITHFVNGQSGFSILNTGRRSNIAGGLPANNPWVGAQVGYLFGDSKEFADNLLVSGRILYEIDLNSPDTSGFHLPVVGNLSNIIKSKVGFVEGEGKDKLDSEVKEIMTSNQGLHIGLYPYYIIRRNETFSLIAHGVAGLKLNGIQDTVNNKVTYLNQGRFSAGLEIGIGRSNAEKIPLTLSITPTITIFDKSEYKSVFGVEKSTINTLELTCVVPLKKGIGVMFEDIFPLSKGVRNVFRVGLIFTAETN